MTEQLVEKIEKLIRQKDRDDYELYCNGEFEYWESRNFDDVFEGGVNIGFTDAILKVIEIIKQENN